jgi:hypothetical protein
MVHTGHIFVAVVVWMVAIEVVEDWVGVDEKTEICRDFEYVDLTAFEERIRLSLRLLDGNGVFD